MDDILFDLYYSAVHRNEELEQTIEELQNDLQQATNEVSILNRQLDRQNNAANDLADIVDTSHKVIDDLKTENKELKFKLKMLTKVYMNSIYGITATDYTDTDSIKETTENDSDN